MNYSHFTIARDPNPLAVWYHLAFAVQRARELQQAEPPSPTITVIHGHTRCALPEQDTCKPVGHVDTSGAWFAYDASLRGLA